MTPITSARPSLLAAAAIMAVTGALAATGMGSSAGAAADSSARAATQGSAVTAAAVHHGAVYQDAAFSGAVHHSTSHSGSGNSNLGRVGSGHPAEVTAAQQARALRYWTAARMARAMPPAPLRDPAIGPASAVPAPAVVGVARVQGRLEAAAVLTDTAAAGWPGGGAVARDTGKVFFTMDGQDYVCTGAVVASANADVVITAAHCVKSGIGSWATNWTFVPGYTQGSRPYGNWTARHYFVANQWSQAANDDDDVAFVTLNPQHAARGVVHIGRVADGLPIKFGNKTAEEFTFGYPAEPPYKGGQLYYCSGRVTQDAFHASPDSGLRCDLTAGTSGGPWLSGFDPVTGTGTITSVSSFKYSTDMSILYGPPLGVVAQGLYNRAQHS
jgi:V8-like Glu-specific endopeptidase